MNLKQALGIKTDDEVFAEVEAEPTIQDARAAISLADRILAAIERRARIRRTPAERKADRAAEAAADERVLADYRDAERRNK